MYIGKHRHLLAFMKGDSAYKHAVAGGYEGTEEEFIKKLAAGNGGGVSDYTDLTNKPSINGVELVGDKTTSDLKLPKVYNDLATPSTTDALSANMGYVLNNKINAHTTVKVFDNIESLINSLNSYMSGEVRVGFGLYVIQLNVPDFWVSEYGAGYNKYSYTTDEAFISEIEENGFVQVGTCKVSILETAKADLTDYVKKSDVIDNVTSDLTTNPLSASQGKALNGKIDGLIKIAEFIGSTAWDNTGLVIDANLKTLLLRHADINGGTNYHPNKVILNTILTIDGTNLPIVIYQVPATTNFYIKVLKFGNNVGTGEEIAATYAAPQNGTSSRLFVYYLDKIAEPNV